jgi:hypothetical protein
MANLTQQLSRPFNKRMASLLTVKFDPTLPVLFCLLQNLVMQAAVVVVPVVLQLHKWHRMPHHRQTKN